MRQRWRSAERATTGAKAQVKIVLICSDWCAEQDWDWEPNNDFRPFCASRLPSSVFQSGQYDAPRRHISKRGSPHLRRTFWLTSMSAILQPGLLRDYYKRRRAAGLRHKSALTAVALKLCRITWRIMTDQRDYTPEPPNPKSDVSPNVKPANASPKKRKLSR
jgi:hypothetical protein